MFESEEILNIGEQVIQNQSVGRECNIYGVCQIHNRLFQSNSKNQDHSNDKLLLRRASSSLEGVKWQ